MASWAHPYSRVARQYCVEVVDGGVEQIALPYGQGFSRRRDGGLGSIDNVAPVSTGKVLEVIDVSCSRVGVKLISDKKHCREALHLHNRNVISERTRY